MQRLVRAAQCRLHTPSTNVDLFVDLHTGALRAWLQMWKAGLALSFSSRSAGSAELPPQQRKSRRSACVLAASAAAPEPLQQRRRQSTQLEDEDAPEPPTTGELSIEPSQQPGSAMLSVACMSVPKGTSVAHNSRRALVCCCSLQGAAGRAAAEGAGPGGSGRGGVRR